MKKQNKKGFTLVELLVVIAILAILATVSVVGYSQFTEKAKKSNDETELHQIALIVLLQLIDGEEKVVVPCTVNTQGHDHSTGCNGYTVYYRCEWNVVKAYTVLSTSNTSCTVATDAQVTESLKQMCGEDNAELVAGDNLKVTLTTDGVLSLEYKHNAKTASTWTLGE